MDTVFKVEMQAFDGSWEPALGTDLEILTVFPKK